MKTSIQQVIVQKDCPLHHALKQMDEINRKLLIVANDDGTFFSLLSIGDIQRAIIRNLPLNTKVSEIVRQDVTAVSYTHLVNIGYHYYGVACLGNSFFVARFGRVFYLLST